MAEPRCMGCPYCHAELIGGSILRYCLLDTEHCAPSLGSHNDSPEWCPLKEGNNE